MAKAFGASEVCITAHHEGGFTLWPSNHSTYGVASSSWKGGKGDVLKEFAAAARAARAAAWRRPGSTPAGTSSSEVSQSITRPSSEPVARQPLARCHPIADTPSACPESTAAHVPSASKALVHRGRAVRA